MRSVFRALPKAELHFHMDGSMRIATLQQLARDEGVKLPSENTEQLARLVQVGESCPSLVEYLQAYEITLSVLQSQRALTQCAFEALEMCHEDGVTYVESRFSPVLHQRRGLSLEQVMEAVLEGHALAEKRLGIKSGLIVCAMRQNPPEEAVKLADLAVRYAKKGVVGFDIAGPEAGFPARWFKDAYDVARRGGIGLTAHAGEADDWRSVDSALRDLKASRLGHGVAMTQNEGVRTLARNNGVCIECCPTSNVLTKAVPSIEQHPLKSFLEAGINATICTDGLTMTATTLSNEYEKSTKALKLKPTQILQCVSNGFLSAFQPKELCRDMQLDAVKNATEILKKNKMFD